MKTGDIVFAKTNHIYDSYTDFYRLVETSKFQIINLNEIDLELPNTTYVFTPWNGEIAPAILDAKERANVKRSKVVWWCLERDICDGRPLSEDVSLVDDIWVSDRSFAKIDSRFRHVVLGGHPNFGITTNTKNFDVCHLAYLWGRRQDIINRLPPHIKIAPEAYGAKDQDKYVATSRLMLNMHQYDKAKIIAPLRFAVTASYRLPLLTEEVSDSFPLAQNTHFVSVPYASLVQTTLNLLQDSALLDDIASNLCSVLTDTFRFDRNVLNAVHDLWS